MHVAWINDQQNQNKLTMQTDHDYRVVPELRDTFADDFFLKNGSPRKLPGPFQQKICGGLALCIF